MPRDGRDGRDGAQGPQGAPGVPGARGRDGDSAYEVARKNGFRGDVDQWLEQMRGPMGEPGERGRDGVNGKDGAQGPRGPEGPPGPRGPRPEHEWRGTELRFENPDGSWGEYVDLQGPKGERGMSGGGAVVVQAANSWDPSGW